MNEEYLTGNKGMDDKIKKALAKEGKIKFVFHSDLNEYQKRNFAMSYFEDKKQLKKAFVNLNSFIFNITPVGKPRMTQKDKWYERETAKKYWQYKDDLKNICLQNKFTPSCNMKIIFYIPFPNFWNSLTKNALNNKPHNKTPDIDNLVKGFLDALMKQDCEVWHIDGYKYWTSEKIGKIEVEHL